MAGHRSPGVRGTAYTAALAVDAVPKQSQATLPGPVGAREAWDRRPASIMALGSDWVTANVEQREAQGQPRAQQRFMVRLAPRKETDNGFERMTFTTREAAAAAIARFVPKPDRVAALVDVGATNPAELLAYLVLTGEIKVLSRPVQPILVNEREQAAPAPRPAPAPVWTPPVAIKAPEYSTFPPELDAAAMAQSLIEAARDGVPFCEECRKAEGSQQAGSP